MRLNDLSIKRLKAPESGQVTYTDDTLPGFGVRVSQGGVKSFVLVHGRRRRRTTIGRYPSIGLRDARKAAKLLLAEKIQSRFEKPPIGFGAALELFLASHFPPNYLKPRTRDETKRLLEKHFLKSLRHEKLGEITTLDVARLVDRLQDTPAEARHAFGAIRQLFNWAVRRGYVDRSPCARLQPPSRAVPRDRVLTKDELRQLLATTAGEDSTFHSIVQLLLLTGQRRNEIASLRLGWIDFDERTITLPAHITKNKRAHTFPFGAMAEAILQRAATKLEQRKTDDPEGAKSDLLFVARGCDTPFAGWSKAKPAFDKRCTIPHWTLHDLRRTCASNMAALGVAVHVTEKLLNHVSGTIGGIVAVYQRHAYRDEMRSAIQAWEARLGAIADNTAQMRISVMDRSSFDAGALEFLRIEFLEYVAQRLKPVRSAIAGHAVPGPTEPATPDRP